MTRLNQANLQQLHADIEIPAYDRSAVTPGMVHFGVGGFHRAHQAMYLDRLMASGQAMDWGIIGAGIMPADRRMHDVLSAQDYLYTLVVKHPDGHRDVRVIGSIIGYIYAPDDPAALIEQMAKPDIRIVSLTITEGGYNIHPVTGEFNLRHPDVIHDLANSQQPRTTFGLIVEALKRRRDRGIEPFTIMSCDNIQGNGEVAKQMFTAYASTLDAALGQWLHDSVSFPNSMVDRITPSTSQDDIDELAANYFLEDSWPVMCEPFTQWVLEDHFTLGRPEFEHASVQVVDDVEPYELMKLRMLNASHQALCYFGYLCGYRYVHDASQDPLFVRFLLDYMKIEAEPTLAAVPGVDLTVYQQTLIERFANPEIRDTIARLCAESSDRIPKWLLPVIRHNLANGGEVTRAAAVVASWARYAEGVDEAGEPIQVVDQLRDELVRVAATNRQNPLAFIENRELFGDLVDETRFREAFTNALRMLHEQGARATLTSLV